MTSSPTTGWPFFRALRQSRRQVCVRAPGDRSLSTPQPIHPYAEKHWEFALLADAAYGETLAGQRALRKQALGAQFDPRKALAHAGWAQWPQFPCSELQARIAATHLRVEVWERRDVPTVAVAFGGTVFDNQMDWRANLRWFLPKGRDEYSDIVHRLAPAFVTEFIRRRAQNPGFYERAQIAATGHSLGGGLAQQFAYCLPLNPAVPRVSNVYAFDPSPVTGYYSVERRVREANCAPLDTDRIYERGEILAIPRSVLSVLFRPSKIAPRIHGARYNLFPTWNPIAGHSMKNMASLLAIAAGRDDVTREQSDRVPFAGLPPEVPNPGRSSQGG